MFRDHLSVKKFFYFFALILLKNAASNFGQCSTFGFCLIFLMTSLRLGMFGGKDTLMIPFASPVSILTTLSLSSY